MASTNHLVAVDPDPNDPLGDHRVRLLQCEKDIRARDLGALQARHESGTIILALRDGKRLPNLVRQALVKDVGISKSEIANRMKLAELYDAKELSNALDSFGSWHGIVERGLYGAQLTDEPTVLVDPPAPAPVKPVEDVEPVEPPAAVEPTSAPTRTPAKPAKPGPKVKTPGPDDVFYGAVKKAVGALSGYRGRRFALGQAATMLLVEVGDEKYIGQAIASVTDDQATFDRIIAAAQEAQSKRQAMLTALAPTISKITK